MQISAYAVEFEITGSRTPSPLKHNFRTKSEKKDNFHKSSCLRSKTRWKLRIYHDLQSFVVFASLGFVEVTNLCWQELKEGNYCRGVQVVPLKYADLTLLPVYRDATIPNIVAEIICCMYETLVS